MIIDFVSFEGANICFNYDKFNVWFGVIIKVNIIVNVNFWIFVY